MTTAALHPFIEAAERDAQLFGVAQSLDSHVRWWFGWLLRALALPVVLVSAQVAPFLFRRHLELLVPLLPTVTERADLAWVRDALALYHETLKVYAPFCMFRRMARELLEEIDEHLDSLEFVAAHDEFLRETVTKIEGQ